MSRADVRSLRPQVVIDPTVRLVAPSLSVHNGSRRRRPFACVQSKKKGDTPHNTTAAQLYTLTNTHSTVLLSWLLLLLFLL